MYQPTRWQPPPVPPRRRRPVWPFVLGGGVALVYVFIGSAVVAGLVDPSPPDAVGPSPSPVGKPQQASPSRDPLSAHVTKAQLGADWPFVHITAGTVRCIPKPDGIGMVIFEPDGGGKPFGLNGTALDGGYRDIPPGEWRKNPDIPGASISVAPLRDPVAKACGLSVPS